MTANHPLMFRPFQAKTAGPEARALPSITSLNWKDALSNDHLLKIVQPILVGMIPGLFDFGYRAGICL
jgi:hypothetical protein